MLFRQHTTNFLKGMIILNVKQKRILIFGAGVVGSIYALRFAQSGLDVTLLARGKRLESLKKDGLRYNDDGVINHISIKTIEKLEDNDIYDFIFSDDSLKNFSVKKEMLFLDCFFKFCNITIMNIFM